MYSAITQDVRVNVAVTYMAEQSTPEDSYYFWAYEIEIRNESNLTVQLLSREWQITDAKGRTEEVRGPGVVGQTPVLRPGEAFKYTSGCPLRTPSGLMVGHYTMTTDTGAEFQIDVPAFSLDSPFETRRMN